MENEKQLKLSNLVLYSKGWYKRSDNIYDDLKKILNLDGYTPFTNFDVYSIIVNNIERSEFSSNFTSLSRILDGIHPLNSWKCGYYVKGNCSWLNIKEQDQVEEYKMETAFIYYVISNLSNLDNEDWKVTVPKYKKYPRPEHITVKRVIEVFNKKK